MSMKHMEHKTYGTDGSKRSNHYRGKHLQVVTTTVRNFMYVMVEVTEEIPCNTSN